MTAKELDVLSVRTFKALGAEKESRKTEAIVRRR